MAVMDSVSKINAVLRTLIALAVVGGISYAAWVGYSKFNQRELQDKKRAEELSQARRDLKEKEDLLKENAREIVSLNQNIAEKKVVIKQKDVEIAKKKIEIARLDTALRLIKVDHRVAILTVLDIEKNPNTDMVESKLQFVEVNDEGKAIDAPSPPFKIVGDVVYIDAWVVKFEDSYIEKADLHRSTSLVQFRRVFGEDQPPTSGHKLYTEKERPKAYGDGEVSEFEKKIWDDFWAFANNPNEAKRLGIKAIHGEAPHIKLIKGKKYRVTLRSSGGLSIKRMDEEAPTKPTT